MQDNGTATDAAIVRDALALSRKAGNYIFLPVAVAGLLSLLLLGLTLDSPTGPEARSLGGAAGTSIIVAATLWKLSRRPRPLLLLTSGIIIGIAAAACAVFTFRALQRSEATGLMFVMATASMAALSTHCFRLWLMLRSIAPLRLESLTKIFEQDAATVPPPDVPDELDPTGMSARVTPKRAGILILVFTMIGYASCLKMRMDGVRERSALLNADARKFGLEPATPSTVWGVVMERGTAEGTDSFTIFENGYVDLRLFPEAEKSPPHDDTQGLARSAHEFVQTAAKYAANADPTEDDRQPNLGEIRFHLLTDTGRSVIIASESDLRNASKFAPLYHQGTALALKLQKSFRMPGIYSPNDPPRFFRACDFSK